MWCDVVGVVYMTSFSYFFSQHVCQYKGQLCKWSTTLSMARTTGRRRPWRSVTSVYITSIIIIGLLLIEDVVNFDVITHTEAVKHV